MRFWFKKGAWASKKGYAVIEGLMPETVRSIAVIRHTALGDMLLTRPFLFELRKAFPQAKITFSVLDHYTRGVPEDLVDRVHIVYRKGKDRLSLKKKIENLQDLGEHDIIFDLADTSRSLLLCLLNTARLKIGFPYKAIYRYLVYDATLLRSDFVFEAELLLHMLHLLGIRTAHPPDFHLRPTPPPTGLPYLVYFTGASTDAKRWSLGHFKQLIAAMATSYPKHNHIILKGIGDWESISALLEGTEEKANIKSAQIDTLEETLSFLKGASLVISNDTGIRHAAIAIQTPTLGLFFGASPGSTQPYRYWPRYEGHDIVFCLDGAEPSVTEVITAAIKLMDEIEKRKENTPSTHERLTPR